MKHNLIIFGNKKLVSKTNLSTNVLYGWVGLVLVCEAFLRGEREKMGRERKRERMRRIIEETN